MRRRPRERSSCLGNDHCGPSRENRSSASPQGQARHTDGERPGHGAVWQYEVTGGGRLWYVIDDQTKTVWLTEATTGHPKVTE